MLAVPLIDHVSAPVRFARVLFPTDFSPRSDHALTYLSPIAAAYHSHVFVLHVLPPESPAAMHTVTEFVPHGFAFDRYEAEKHMRRLENSGRLSQFAHSSLLLSGGLREVLEGTIQRHNVDLVVIATHGRGGVNKLILGSVAEEVSRRAPCAVLMLGPHAPSAGPGYAFRHVLYATEFSTGSLNALRYALSIAQQYRADLTLLHVCSFMEGGPFVANEAVLANERERLKALVPEDAELAKPPTLVARIGITPEVILKTASASGTDLIVMGVRSTHAVTAATHMPWTVAHQVVCHAKCPVLTVRG